MCVKEHKSTDSAHLSRGVWTPKCGGSREPRGVLQPLVMGSGACVCKEGPRSSSLGAFPCPPGKGSVMVGGGGGRRVPSIGGSSLLFPGGGGRG